MPEPSHLGDFYDLDDLQFVIPRKLILPSSFSRVTLIFCMIHDFQMIPYLEFMLWTAPMLDCMFWFECPQHHFTQVIS